MTSRSASTDINAVLADAHAAWSAGDRTRAIALLEAFAARAAGTAEVWARLGAYGLATARNADAAHWLDRAVALRATDAASWNNLGTARLRLGRADDAVAAYRQAGALDASAIGPRVNLANALMQAGDIDGAVAALEAARALRPDSHELLNNLGNLYKEQGRIDAALAAYGDARRAFPQFGPAFSNLLAATKLSERHSPAEIFALHRAFAATFEHEWAADYQPSANVPDPERRLRIGYVSPDCHTALPAFVEPVLRGHDRARFDVYAYFNNPQPQSALDRLGPVTARIMAGHDDAAVAQWIRTDGIDVLVDIAGHTGHNRLGVFGRKPAPVQLTWLDYLNTTGLDAVDYRVTDAVSDPVGTSEAVHSEALLRIAPTQWCWSPPAGSAQPSPLPMLRTGFPTLGSFNAGVKLTDGTLALWSRLLGALPQARMVIVGVPEGAAQDRVRAALDAPARVRVLARVDAAAYREEAAAVDIALDTRPFSGATTTLEMLWQGVPVVTWPGATSPSRSTASLLSALALDDWIASDADGYVDIVRRACAASAALTALRQALPARLRDGALCDAAAFTRAFEDVLRDAWRAWCAAKRGTPLPGAPRLPPAGQRRIESDERLADIEARLAAGTGAGAVDDARALLAARPEWHAAQRACLRTLMAWSADQPGLVERMFPPPVESARKQRVSVIVCSIDPRKFQACTDSYRRHFAAHDLEIVGVHDARSLAEGYNRGAAQAKGEVLVFSHDDIELVTKDFAPRLLAHLQAHDGVGVAGASRITGPKWDHAGAGFLHGQVLHPAPQGAAGARLMISGFQELVCTGMRGLDGALFAVRRHVWEAHRFDAERYDGFHLYDLDFTWRASGAGARLAVALDLLIFHQSTGKYDAAWRRYAARFAEQAGLDFLAPARPGVMQVRLDTMEQIDTVRAALLHFAFGRPA